MDQRLLFLINRQWTNPGLDRLMATISSIDFWWPFLVLAAGWFAWKGGTRGRWFLVTLGLLLALGEVAVDNPLKHGVHRLRPWQAEAGVRQIDLARHVRPRQLALFAPLEVNTTIAPVAFVPSAPNPGRSFPSGHEFSNVCAAVTLTIFYRRRGWLYFGVAALIGYSRVYLGAHWPSDVLIGACLGAAWALLGIAVLRAVVQRVAGAGVFPGAAPA